MLSLKSYESDVRPDWCPGCGDFGVLAALKNALLSLEIPPSRIVISSGIGCSSNLPGYIRTYGHHGLHGRPVPVAVGVKVANPSLTVIVTAGDGDEYGIGFNHVVHAARRNNDIKLIVMNNEIYGLTTGQLSPTSKFSQKTKTSPDGSIIYPLNPLSTLLGAGATFIARGFSGDPKHLSMLYREAIKHRGFALVDTLSPCVTWHDIYDEVRSKMYKLEDVGHNPSDALAAYNKMNETDKIPLGIFYRTEDKPSYEELIESEVTSTKPVDSVTGLNPSQIKDIISQFS
ncbi:MAG: 2-oxoacid:ferredoxin oxidoreductase subunit beta [Candidatus Marsarchaeota archaeon]|nr:2-oxoacid:ferredoxin oxidoreductase subunit beta [Candidatus Marsarchaeota archaeon]